ncbi:MAG: hypothetical protein VCD00_07930 [Candidatus Hydrogenedentota bacterium]
MCLRLLRIAVLLTVFFGLTQAHAASSGNPDTDHITGASGSGTIKLMPRNDIDDHRNLQWAFDNTAPGGTVELGAGTFFLGDGKAAPRKTAWMRRGLKVVGVKEGAIWRTVIRGGGEVLTPGVGGALESGPIRIKLEGDDHTVILEDIWFREWACEVVFILACNGFEFRGCRITDPVNAADPSKTRFVHALWTQGNDARGDFIAENNLVELGQYDGPLAEDEQFMGIFTSNHDNIRIVNNTITGTDEAIEILMNRYGDIGEGDPKAAKSPAEIVVANNTIDVTGTPGARWGGSWAILVAGNLNVDRVLIENNHVTKRGEGWGIGLSGANFEIVDNTFIFEEHNGKLSLGAMTIGGYPKLAGKEMGSSMTNSVIKGNTFEGRVRDHALFFMAGSAGYENASTGNRIDMGDSFNTLGAKTTLTLSQDMRDNEFNGDTGKVADNAKKGANRY